MKENIVYIVNPKSGKLSKTKKIRIIENIDPSTKPEIVFSQSLEDAGKKAQEFMLKKYLVVACGGDGFINTIAQKAIDYACNMALLPFGRGNDFARSLDLNTLEKAIDASIAFSSVLRSRDLAKSLPLPNGRRAILQA